MTDPHRPPPQPSVPRTVVQVLMAVLATASLALVAPVLVGFGVMTGCGAPAGCGRAEVVLAVHRAVQWALVAGALGLAPWARMRGWDRRRVYRAAWTVTVSAIVTTVVASVVGSLVS